nr:porin [uncultured Holophaga sp.]
MKNRLSLLLVAGVLAMPAVAATPEWNLYGTLVVEAYNAKLTGATAGYGSDVSGRWMMSCATSNIGFKGGMQVADDVKAIWQVESQVMTDGSESGTKNQNLWASRNSGVGLTGSWGTVMAGQWDTPYKAIQVPLTQIRAGVLTDVSILGNRGGIVLAQTTDAVASESFKRCQGNSLQYWSPNIQGFQAKVMYALNEYKVDGGVNPSLLSMSAAYDIKPANLKLSLGYESHKDTAHAGDKDTGLEFSATWMAPTKTRVTATVEQVEYDRVAYSTTVAADYKRTAWFVSAGQPITEHHKVWANIGQAANGKTNGVKAEDGATQYSVGYTYAFNKNSEIYAFYGGINNKAAGIYNTMGPVPQTITATASTGRMGGDVKTYGMGIFYSF